MEKHQRRSIRLPDYDYTQPGAYFVNLVVQDRQPILGEIQAGQMMLSRLGQVVRKVGSELPRHYPHLAMDILMIMPNHVHLIMELTCAPVRRGETRRGLPEMVRALKSFSARQINRLRNTPGVPVWQRNYYDHIIRTQDEWERIRWYIENNPGLWEEDQENPAFLGR
jgi:putative transposase